MIEVVEQPTCGKSISRKRKEEELTMIGANIICGMNNEICGIFINAAAFNQSAKFILFLLNQSGNFMI